MDFAKGNLDSGTTGNSGWIIKQWLIKAAPSEDFPVGKGKFLTYSQARITVHGLDNLHALGRGIVTRYCSSRHTKFPLVLLRGCDSGIWALQNHGGCGVF